MSDWNEAIEDRAKKHLQYFGVDNHVGMVELLVGFVESELKRLSVSGGGEIKSIETTTDNNSRETSSVDNHRVTRTDTQKHLESFFKMRVAFSHRLQNDPDYQDLVADFLAIEEECSMIERTLHHAEVEFTWIKNELPQRFGAADFEDMGAFSRRLRDRAAKWNVAALKPPVRE